MDAPLHICKATPADAGIISRIVERSIRVGCALDHRNNPQTVAIWTHNKTIEHIQPWLTDQRLYLNIALLQDKPVGVAMASVTVPGAAPNTAFSTSGFGPMSGRAPPRAMSSRDAPATSAVA